MQNIALRSRWNITVRSGQNIDFRSGHTIAADGQVATEALGHLMFWDIAMTTVYWPPIRVLIVM